MDFTLYLREVGLWSTGQLTNNDTLPDWLRIGLANA